MHRRRPDNHIIIIIIINAVTITYRRAVARGMRFGHESGLEFHISTPRDAAPRRRIIVIKRSL